MPSVPFGEMTHEHGYSKRNNYSLNRKPLARYRNTVVLITETGRQTSKKSIFVSRKGKSHTEEELWRLVYEVGPPTRSYVRHFGITAS